MVEEQNLSESEQELTEAKRKLRTANQLTEELAKGSELWVRYLFITNAGGTLATLSFMGAMIAKDQSPSGIIPLIAFIVGLISVGMFLTAITTQRYVSAIRALNVVAEAISHTQVPDPDPDNKLIKTIDLIFKYSTPVAFFAFIFGAIWGLVQIALV